MKSLPSSAHPVATLREYARDLEAAITFCLAKPKPKAAHRLRTLTRRIEAQILLLELLPQVPHPNKLSGKVLRRLGKLRKAAGHVRDLDVQIELLKHPNQVTDVKRVPKQLRDEARDLGASLEKSRQKEAARLQEILEDSPAKLIRALECLLMELEPVESLVVSPAELSRLVREWFSRTGPLLTSGEDGDDDRLHEIRKAAKTARYLLESAPPSARNAKSLAAKFEDLQQAGGEWHDLLTLTAEAKDFLPARSALTTSLTTARDRNRTAFHGKLERAETFAPGPQGFAPGAKSRKL